MSKVVYISLLRGVNVGGQKPMKMEQLRKSFESLGLEGVKTYVQSGNVVFNAPKKPPAFWSRKIQQMILDDFGFPVPVVTRSFEEIGNVLKSNPFLKEKGSDPAKLHVVFLSRPAGSSALQGLEALAAAPDRFHCSGQEIYLYCPNGYGKTRLSNNNIEKALSVSATTRNWNTVAKLYGMSSGL